jgi:hypothetical protein
MSGAATLFLSRRLPSLFGQTYETDHPIEGDIDISQKLYEGLTGGVTDPVFLRAR